MKTPFVHTVQHTLRQAVTTLRGARTALLCTSLAITACAATTDGPSPQTRNAVGLDYVTHPRLLDALMAQKPHLLNGRGGRPPLIILNDGPQPVPVEMLNLVPTKAVTRIERRMADHTQVGNVATLRITYLVGPLPEGGMALDECKLLKAKAKASEPHHREYMRRCYTHDEDA